MHPHLKSFAQERQGLLGSGPEEAAKMIQGLECLHCEAKLEKRRLQADLLIVFQYLKGTKMRIDLLLGFGLVGLFFHTEW